MVCIDLASSATASLSVDSVDAGMVKFVKKYAKWVYLRQLGRLWVADKLFCSKFAN